jgi:hypothetical protein
MSPPTPAAPSPDDAVATSSASVGGDAATRRRRRRPPAQSDIRGINTIASLPDPRPAVPGDRPAAGDRSARDRTSDGPHRPGRDDPPRTPGRRP